MAKRRMFSMQIVDTDAFLEMPLSSQSLYFHLAMRADDEGFIGNPNRIIRLIGCSEDDFKILAAKRFLLTFESGVVVIKHWLIHNTIRMDRFSTTSYKDEKNLLNIKENKSYTDLATNGKPNGNQLVPQVKLSKVKLSEEKRQPKYIFKFKDGTVGREKWGKWEDDKNGAILGDIYLQELKEAGYNI